MRKQQEVKNSTGSILSERETNESLCVLIQQGNHRAKEQLLLRNTGMIHAIAWRERRKYAYLTLDLEDLWAAGQMGMLRAAELFRVSDGNSFTTYAWMHVRQAVQREIIGGGTMVKIPVYLHDRMHKISVYRESFSNTDYGLLAKRVTEGENEGFGLTEKEVRECLCQVEPMISIRSLNEIVTQDGTMEREEIVCDPETATPDEAAAVRLMVSSCLSCLTERERRVIAMRYGLDGKPERTLVEIGKILQVTKERVRQLEQRALKKMRMWGQAE